ncbi:hypothetical protein JB92DRAFT_2838409 [Gautieria morchelliformis]|nr:hypothetical protein JB92DRAFT_2838409 [Gautieria morchelliformis]
MFLSSNEEGDNALTPKTAKTWDPPQHIREAARSPLIEIILDEQTSALHQKGHVNTQVVEADKVTQSVVKQGYPKHAFLLGWKIYIRHEVVIKPVKSTRQGRCVGGASMIARGCVSREEYEVKEEKDTWKAERENPHNNTDGSRGTSDTLVLWSDSGGTDYALSYRFELPGKTIVQQIHYLLLLLGHAVNYIRQHNN